MNVKRYDVETTDEPTESAHGDWVKYEDLDVVTNVVRAQIIDLQRDLKEANAEIDTLRAIAQNNS